ncbi:MAG: ABC transporter permease [Gammaproteobacteria bacterium]|nr:ABC transporter permease [Gammaproteobacteria bacterium]MDE0366566.1 ABC transporter permease [Gammaproteobacteria bacterium]
MRSAAFWMHDRRLVAGILIVGLFAAMAAAPWLFTSLDPAVLNLEGRLTPPSPGHWLGTDSTGNDVYTRIVYGSRTTLGTVIAVLAIASLLGIAVGSISGSIGGWLDNLLMRTTDVFLAFPPLILALAINAVLGRGLRQTVFAVALLWWPAYARLVRGQILAVRRQEFVESARVIGASRFRIIRHMLPNVIDPVIVRLSLDAGFVALTAASLSYLGLGAQPPTPEWGRMVAEGQMFLLDQWWVAAFPGVVLFILVVGFNLIGEAVGDRQDLQTRGSTATVASPAKEK